MDANLYKSLRAEGIKRIVWEGTYVSTDEGRVIRGSVGLTQGGDFMAAEVTLYQEHGPGGRVSFSGESYRWGQERYAHKEQAIFGARSKVAQTVKYDRLDEREVQESVPARSSAAEKYGKSKALGTDVERSLSR